MKYLLIILTIYLQSLNKQSAFCQKTKDTLFIKYNDPKLITNCSSLKKTYIIKGSGNNGITYFTEEENFLNISVKKTTCLKTFLQKNNKIYSKKGIIDDLKLIKVLEKFIVFIVEKNELIKVSSFYEIN